MYPAGGRRSHHAAIALVAACGCLLLAAAEDAGGNRVTAAEDWEWERDAAAERTGGGRRAYRCLRARQIPERSGHIDGGHSARRPISSSSFHFIGIDTIHGTTNTGQQETRSPGACG